MMNNTADSGKTRPSCPATAPSEHRDEVSAEACLSLAERLTEVLREEATVLRRFDCSALMRLLPAKQCLISELAHSLDRWKSERAGEDHAQNHPPHDLLKEHLVRINKLNHSNSVFIKDTLAFYDDFVRCVLPANYTAGGQHPSGSKVEPPKGLKFRKEI